MKISRIFSSFFAYPILIMLFIPNLSITAEITPIDVYYLAKSIDESLMSMYGLTSTLNKKKITNNLRSKNVYYKALMTLKEFDLLHNDEIDDQKITDAANFDLNKSNPSYVYGVLTIIRDHLLEKKMFIESKEERTPKTPSDVFQMLRQISMHHMEIAKKKHIATDWATPKQVYETVTLYILPVVESIAKESGTDYTEFAFPKQPVGEAKPRNVYKLLMRIYQNIAAYYTNRGGYDPILFEAISDCDDITPADALDIAGIIGIELRSKSGKIIPPKTAARYEQWKSGKNKVIPGDTFRLLQHNLILSRRVAEKTD